MGNTDLIQVGLFKPIIEILGYNGVKTKKLISSSGLKSFSLDNKELYVPSKLVYNFFSEVKNNEGIDDLLSTFGHDIQLIGSGQWGEVMSSMPDLLTTCRLSAKFDQVQLTHERIRFGIEGTKAIYSCKYLDSPIKGRD